MTLVQLEHAIMVACKGSFHQAAAALYITQPSLSQSISRLEEELGFHLFERSKKGVSLTRKGADFIADARSLVFQADSLLEKHTGNAAKQRFSVSCQHYSFAIKAFIELIHKNRAAQFDFSILESRTKEVMEDVFSGRSEIGVLYVNDLNRGVFNRLFQKYGLTFHHLVDACPYVYLHKDHPLAHEKSISFAQLADYPFLAIDQRDEDASLFSEEILSGEEYPMIIHTSDRATNLNLMVGLQAYTICSGIISKDINGTDYLVIPLEMEEERKDGSMEIGFIMQKDHHLSMMAKAFLEELYGYFEKETPMETQKSTSD